jgi:serine protease Do
MITLRADKGIVVHMRVRILAGCVLAISCAVPLFAASDRPAAAHAAPEGFADLAQSLLPAVVNISSTQAARAEGDTPEMPKFPPGSPFEQFFHDFMNRHHGDNGDNGNGDDNGDQDQDQDNPDGPDAAPDQGAPHPHHLQSLGSGFIIDPSGIVVTNNHVIDGADEITVTLQDNTTLKATLIGHDDRWDLAVLKVTPEKPLPAVHFGDSDAARVGDWVLAIGNPFGLGGTVTAGIISARGRDIQQGPYDDFIQTDAAINRGNSGGPLFDMAGEVIGINTAILSPSGGSIGLGFSIPSGEAKVVIDQLRKFGRARRGWLGVRIQQVTPDIAESLGLKGGDGALVAGVNNNGPADRAHIQNGDVILTFNGQPLHEMRTLPRVVAETPIDAKVPVDIWRNGKRQTVQVVVAEMPEDEKPVAVVPKKPATGTVELGSLGMKVSPITDDLRQKFKLDDKLKGIVVTDVASVGTAADRGLKPGDVILEVQQKTIAQPADLQKQLTTARDQGRKSVLLLVQGKDGLRWVPLPVKK